MAADLSTTVKRLLDKHIFSVTQLEILLLLRRHSDRAWRAGEVARELYSSEQAAEDLLNRLAMSGLLLQRGSHYQYQLSTEMDEDVQETARAYAEAKTRVIDHIFRKPQGDSAFTSFADAFRLKRDEES
jgi:hypothetical protein